MCLKAANILCFCETWLTASQPSPSILDTQTVLRCDRQTSNNKGGTICVPSYMQPHNTSSFTSTGIEAVCTSLTLPNDNHMQVLALYRSPSVNLQALTNMLSRILDYVLATDMPTVILGDFNEDIVSHPDSSIVSLMSNHGFAQLVRSPTTAKGTLIDHVYYNRPTSDVILEVCDTYYSDHDTVYCSIPLPLNHQ